LRAGRQEEADSLAQLIDKGIKRQAKHTLSGMNGSTDSKQMWQVVQKLTNKTQCAEDVADISADMLNKHYAAISNDPLFQLPVPKQTVMLRQAEPISEWHVFRALDCLRPTATGLNRLPAWFIRLGAPIFSRPLASLFNMSLITSTVPAQWKQAVIKPIPKIPSPQQLAKFRPISITPILTRVMERMVVANFIYTCLLPPPPTPTFYHCKKVISF
jgi:hypothetical protein